MDRDGLGEPPVSTLRLVEAMETHTLLDGNRTMNIEVPFLDFVIDGQSLRQRVAGTGHSQAFVTPLCRAWTAEAVRRSADQLLGGPTAQNQIEIEFLTCAICGHRDCGAILADVVITPRTVTWQNWKFTDWEATEVLTELPPAIFGRDAYVSLLMTATEAVAVMPYDEKSNRPRRFLWPWQWGWRMP